MGRKAKPVEYLETLREMAGKQTQAEFAKACGKSPANMANYLAGNPVPGRKFLRSATESLFGWGIVPLMEVERIPPRLSKLPAAPGVYVIFDSGAQVLYVGKATNFRAEIPQTLSRRVPVGFRLGPKLHKQYPRIKDLAYRISLYEITSARLRHNIEVLFLRVFANQTHNNNIGHFC